MNDRRVNVFVLILVMVAGLGECRSEESPDQRIAWHSNLERGLALARQTNRPIFLVSGAPSCLGVPGVW